MNSLSERDFVTVSPENTFENFVEGKCNRITRSCAFAISENMGDVKYNPFIISSPVGCGKSHLMQAMSNKIVFDHPEIQIIHVGSYWFIQKFTESVLYNRKNEFLDFCRNSHVLMLDDFHNFQGKEKSQEMLLKLFDHLKSNKSQLIFDTYQTLLKETDLILEIISRFRSGLMVFIDKPDFETRLEILKKKVIGTGFNIDETVLNYLARTIDSDIRSLEGALISLMANTLITKKKEIDIPMAELMQERFVKRSH